jgi:hypothetical protein
VREAIPLDTSFHPDYGTDWSKTGLSKVDFAGFAKVDFAVSSRYVEVWHRYELQYRDDLFVTDFHNNFKFIDLIACIDSLH